MACLCPVRVPRILLCRAPPLVIAISYTLSNVNWLPLSWRQSQNEYMSSVSANMSVFCRRSVGASTLAVVSRRHRQCPVENCFGVILWCTCLQPNVVSCTFSGSRCKYSPDCFHTGSKYRGNFGFAPKSAMSSIVVSSHMRPSLYGGVIFGLFLYDGCWALVFGTTVKVTGTVAHQWRDDIKISSVRAHNLSSELCIVPIHSVSIQTWMSDVIHDVSASCTLVLSSTAHYYTCCMTEACSSTLVCINVNQLVACKSNLFLFSILFSLRATHR